ncbi:MAG TPA: restriction endonuclease subunit S [Tenuifilaceae bacterium]|nr:restriction endonuclease subunit S [Tenuifilaceae bacterium]HPI46115.1 restriction endonuclease subunit S [Tenuifilaceae bacterium]
MKQGWEIKKLGELCTIKGRIGYRGYTKQDLVSKGEGAITLSPSNIVNCKLQFNNSTYISWFKYNESPEIKINIGDIIYCKTASIGKLALVEYLPEMATINPQFVVFKELKCFNKFLYYGLLTEDFKLQASEIISGTAIPTLSQTNLAQLVIPTPPLSEQQRIVSILDQAFAAIDKAKANAEQNLKNTKELFESYLQGVFEKKGDGWEEKTLKSIGITQTGTTPKTTNKNNYGDFIPFIKPADIDIFGNGEIRYDNEGLSEEGLSNGRKILQGSILMVCIGASIGKVGFTDRDVSSNQQINALTVNTGLHPKFFYYALRTKGFYNQVIINSSQATLPLLIKSKWEILKVNFPISYSEQKSIVQKLDALSIETKRLEAIYQQKINNLEDLKNSILDKAFKGEL